MIVIIEIVNVMLTEQLCMLKMTAIKKISLTGRKGPQASKQTKCITAKKAGQKGKVLSNYQIQLSFIVLFTTKRRLEERQIQGQWSYFFFLKATESQF